jgi:hypothetical protein
LEDKATSSFHYNRKLLLAAFLVIIVVVSSFVVVSYLQDSSQAPTNIKNDPYVGVAFCGNTTAEAFALIDRTKDYTNLFVLDTGRSALSRNETAVYQICDYATANGLSIIINLGIDSVTEDDVTTWFWDSSIPDIRANWTQRWGTKFLGMYYNDEVGGIQLDGEWERFYERFGANLSHIDHPALRRLGEIKTKMDAYTANGTSPDNYDLEADFFVNLVLNESDPGLAKLNHNGIPSFTSDYGLYWWDYLGGFDVMLAELGWNASVAQQIDQVKGAARLQNKDWGAMITWKYDDVPFLDSAKSIYDQMLESYQAGAKYIMIFNYAKDKNATNTAEAMVDQHYMALYQFWHDIHSKQYEDNSKPEAALVLPHNYGWGMRNPNDTIWGFWPSDSKTRHIAINMATLLDWYGTKLDIVYEDPAYPVSSANYTHVYYWGQTINYLRTEVVVGIVFSMFGAVSIMLAVVLIRSRLRDK